MGTSGAADNLWSDFVSPRTILACYLIAVILAVVFAASTSTIAFSAYNSQWDGTDDIRALSEDIDTEVTIAVNTSYYDRSPPEETVALVLSPETGYTQSERMRVAEFVRDGGTLIVAEDYKSHANPLLRSVGATARVNGTPLYDTQNYYRTSAFPKTKPTHRHPAADNVTTVVFNHGTAVDPGNSTIILRSSAYSYLDTTDDNDLNHNETLQRYPVGTVEEVGKGRVFVLGDPSLFINAMLERGDNAQFVSNLLAEDERLLLDYSQSDSIPLLARITLTLNHSPQLLTATGGALIVVLALLDRRVDIALKDWWQERQLPNSAHNQLATESGIRRYLQKEHPDWDPERLQRVTQGIMKRRWDTTDDD